MDGASARTGENVAAKAAKAHRVRANGNFITRERAGWRAVIRG
jgi:hypothetical protein